MPKQLLKFPLSDEQEYKGRIIFESTQESFQTLGDIASSAVSQLEGVKQDELTQLLGDNNQTVGSGLPTPEVLDVIQLYLPQTLQFADAIEYTNVDLGIVGGAAAVALRNNATGGEIARRIFRSSLPSLQSLQDAVNLGLTSEAAQVASLRVASRISSGVQGAIETETGITLNPNRRSTLRGIGIRRFRFTFNLIPNSQKEANQITKIIKSFRTSMYPAASGRVGDRREAPGLPGDGAISSFVDNANVSVALRFPHKFNIKLRYGTKQVATGILPCFLEAADIVYNPNAMSMHTDGNFQETAITLSFIEERALVKSDIESGF